MAEPTLLAIDQGTTSSRAILFSSKGEILNVQQKELELFYPHKGWVEQNANAIWEDTLSCCKAVLKKAGRLPAAIGITNQRETTVIWDKKSGEPIYNAIVWQDRRTADFCAQLKEQGAEEGVRAKTGLLLDPYFSATKIAWILDHVEGARGRAEKGELLFGTVESWLIWKLTGGQSHVSDITNASRTMLYNIVEQRWDDELLELFNVPKALLPEVKDNACAFGRSDKNVLGAELLIAGSAGDQQASLIGQACYSPGMVKSTYGTGCFALMNIGDRYKTSEHKLLTTIAYRIDDRCDYAIEGSIFVAGAAIQWLRDGLGLFDHSAESEAMAESVEDNNSVYFVPAFTGLGAPYWEPNARGMICGLGRESTKAHIARAALEAQAYQTLDLIGAMEADGGYAPKVLRIDGGLVANRFMCQFLADMLGRRVEVPKVHEATAWGAAALAGLHVGLYTSLEDIGKDWQAVDIYEPKMSEGQRETLYEGWVAAVKMVLPE